MFSGKRKNRVIPEKDIQMVEIFDCNFLEEKNALFSEICRDTFVNEKIIVDLEIRNPLHIEIKLKDI